MNSARRDESIRILRFIFFALVMILTLKSTSSLLKESIQNVGDVDSGVKIVTEKKMVMILLTPKNI